MDRYLSQFGIVDVEEIPVRVAVLQLRRNERAQPLVDRCLLADFLPAPRHQRRTAETQRLKVDLLLRPIVEVDGAFGDAGSIGDLLDCRSFKALLRKDGARRLENSGCPELCNNVLFGLTYRRHVLTDSSVIS